MIQDNVAAVLLGVNQFTQNTWTPIHAAGIPFFIASSGNPDVLADPDSTFVMQAGPSAIQNLIIGAAKKAKAKKVSAVVIDVPPGDPDLRGQDALPEGGLEARDDSRRAGNC